MEKISRLSPPVIVLITASVLSAQGILERDLVPLKNWDTPMYWQPSVAESKDAVAKQLLVGNAGEDRGASITPQAQTPANSLVFVGMTPCRVVNTRTGSGFTGAFGPPHSGILALCAGTPIIGLSYLPKTDGILARLGFERWVIPAAELDADALAGKLRAALGEEEALREQVRERLPEARASARRAVDLTLAAADGRPG